jgi:hypothetical protein
MGAGAIAIFFAAGAILAYLKSYARRRQFAMGCAFALGSTLQALVLSIQWGVDGHFGVFTALAVGVLIAWSLAGAVYMFIGDGDGLVPFFWAGALNASLLLLGRIVGANVDHSVGTALLSAIVIAMFVVPAAGIGALLTPDLPTVSRQVKSA